MNPGIKSPGICTINKWQNNGLFVINGPYFLNFQYEGKNRTNGIQ